MSARLGVFAALALAACGPSRADPQIADQWRSIEVSVRPAQLGAERVGDLAFRGGLELSSSDAQFGGLSDLAVLDDGRVIALTDNGAWFSARLMFDDHDALAGLSEARMALMRDENGRPFENKAAGDSEDLAHLPDGRFAVSFEQSQSVRLYDLNRDGPFGAAARGPALAGAGRLPGNAGLEALAATADGALLVGAEDSGTLWRAALDARAPAPPLALYPLEPGFSLTSLDRLPGGDFVALERFYAPAIGAQARITRISADSLRAGAPRVRQWALMSPPLSLDNFEGVSAVRRGDGGVRLYIVSDDNFSPRQRTLLLAFDVEVD